MLRRRPDAGRRAVEALAADLGLAGLLVPEELGGAGASAREAAVVAGGARPRRRAGPVPDQRGRRHRDARWPSTRTLRDLLGRARRGRRTAALAVRCPRAPDGARPRCRREPTATGRPAPSPASPAVPEADVLLVPVATGDGIELYAVPAAAASRSTPVVSLDMTRRWPTSRSTARAGQLVGRGRRRRRCDRRSRRRRAAGLRAGRRRAVVPGRPPSPTSRSAGSSAGPSAGSRRSSTASPTCTPRSSPPRAAARYAAATLAADDPDAPVATAVAQAYCGDVAVHAAEEAVQLHGGIGMTWEHPAHLYLKRAKADQIASAPPGGTAPAWPAWSTSARLSLA